MILVTGGEGQLGRELAELLTAAGVPHRAPGRAELDVTDTAALERLFAGEPPAGVLHCAAMTQVDRCEAERDLAFRVNAEATKRLARLCAARDVPLLYVSTDFVFDGTARTPYHEESAPHPLSVYGASKLAGEKAVRWETARHHIVRTAWVFGPYGACFPRAILRAAAEGRPLRVVADQTGSPTYARDLAEGLLFLLGIPDGTPAPPGTYHLTSAGCCTWRDLAVETLRQAGWDTPVAPITTAELARPAPRPAYSVLALDRVRSLGWHPRPWQEAAPEYLSRLRAREPELFPAEVARRDR